MVLINQRKYPVNQRISGSATQRNTHQINRLTNLLINQSTGQPINHKMKLYLMKIFQLIQLSKNLKLNRRRKVNQRISQSVNLIN